MHNLAKKDYGLVYRLKFGRRPATIDFIMSRSIYGRVAELLPNYQLIKIWQTESEVGEFEIPNESGEEGSHFGFRSALFLGKEKRSFADSDTDNVTLRFPIASGNATLSSVQTLYALFFALGVVGREMSTTDSKDVSEGEAQFQLLHIESLGLEKGLGGAGIWISLSPRLCGWLAEKKEGTWIHDNLTSTLVQGYGRLSERILDFSDRSSCYMRSDRLPLMSLNLPGNACNLTPDNQWYPLEAGKGYSLVPHNVDDLWAQIAFLMAAVCLYDLAYRDIYHEYRH